MYCFACHNIRSPEGSVQRDWGFGPRNFCKACALRVESMPLVSDVVPRHVQSSEPDAAVRPAVPTRQKVSMAAWVRERAGLPMDELCRQLVETFPDSKPGQNPKLAKGYVSCYLKK